MEGVVKSYVAEKRYGFIDGRDGQAYFFHVNDFAPQLSGGTSLNGALVSFEPTATPKGLAAKRLKLERNQATEWVVPDDFIICREDTPRKGRIVAKLPSITVSDSGSPENVKQQLRYLADNLGANALLGLSYEKKTGSSGNYEYTVHSFTGWPALVAVPRLTTDLAIVEAAERQCADLVATMMERHQAYLTRLEQERLAKLARDRRQSTGCLAIVVIIIAMIILANH